MRALSEGFRNITTFSGRTPRRQFWPFTGVVFGVGYVLYMIALFPAVGGVLMSASSGAMHNPREFRASEDWVAVGNQVYVANPSVEASAGLPPMLTAMLWSVVGFVAVLVLLLSSAVVRRLHDTGRSGWWGLLPLPFLFIGLGMMPLMMPLLNMEAEGDVVWWTTMLFAVNVLYILVMITLIVFLVQPSQAEANRFGAVPVD